jgi:phage-related protein
MHYDIKFYEDKSGDCPFLTFISKLRQKGDKRSKNLVNTIFIKLKQLQLNGTMDGMPDFEHIKGSKYPLWQIRIKHVTGNHRIFCCPWNEQYVILNHFIKKERKTPKKEIRKAERWMDDFIKREKRGK